MPTEAGYRSGSAVLERRLSDLLNDWNFAEVQLMVLREEAGPHQIKDVGLRVAVLHRRLDALESKLRRRARVLGEDPNAPGPDLRRRLAGRVDRRSGGGGNGYRGIERRLWVRREADRLALERAAASEAARAGFPASFCRLIETISQPLFLADGRWRCLMANQPALHLLGLTLDELRRRTMYDLLNLADLAWNDSGGPGGRWRWQRPLRLRRKDGAEVWVQARVLALHLSGGRANVLLGRPLG